MEHNWKNITGKQADGFSFPYQICTNCGLHKHEGGFYFRKNENGDLVGADGTKECLNNKNMSEYIEVAEMIQNARVRATNYIRQNIRDKYNGHHVLDDESETFIEEPFEDDGAWKVTEIKVSDNGDIYYTHANPYDEYDWHYIGGMSLDDLLYVMSLY
jgi:hypothetical protein